MKIFENFIGRKTLLEGCSLSAFQNEVDEVCGIFSSKDIVQPLFLEESLNVR